jgi:hypothetical protein
LQTCFMRFAPELRLLVVKFKGYPLNIIISRAR